MVPRIGRQGRSFKGAAAYYLHDKDASTSKRVAFTHTENLPTDDPERAFDWMAYTAMDAENIKRASGVKRTGGPAEKTVWSMSLSWHPEQDPGQEHMIDAANSALAALGLQKHQVVMAAHNDEPHPHIHAIVNLIDPETGRSASLPFTKEKLSKWAQEYEREHGKIYCEQRVENNAKREQAKEQKTDHKALIADLYHAADSGKAFQAALSEHGYKLAQGKRIVVIDPTGKAHNVARGIEGVKERDIRAKLSDITLPDIDDVQGGKQQEGARAQKAEKPGTEEPDKGGEEPHQDAKTKDVDYFDRDEQDRQWQESIIDAGIKADQQKPKTAKSRRQREENGDEDESRRLNEIQNRQLAELGKFYTDNEASRQKLNDELEAAYGKDERKLRQDIEDRESGLKNAGRLRRFLMVLTGQFTRTRQDIVEKTWTLDNILSRKQERTDALEKQIEESRQRLEARHQQERAPGRRESNELVGVRPSPAPAKDFKARQDQNQLDSGYEARRAAFMGQPQPGRHRESVNSGKAAREQTTANSSPALANDFGTATQGDAGYEARRAAFMAQTPNQSQQEPQDAYETDNAPAPQPSTTDGFNTAASGADPAGAPGYEAMNTATTSTDTSGPSNESE